MKRRDEEVDQSVEKHLKLFSAPPVQEIDDAKERTRRRLSMQPVGEAEELQPQSGRWRWAAVAAAAVVLFALVMQSPTIREFVFGIDARAVVEAADGGLSQDFGRVLQAGETIEAGSVVRANGSGAMLKLADGSHIEMRAQSKLSLERANDGVRVQLNDGDVIVSAAKQHGHLYVQTKDVKVSAIGTLFLVQTEETGSRVAVIEGEVRVQQGTTEKNLRTGEQVNTNPLMQPVPVSEQIAWSRSALPPVAPQVQRPPAPAPPARETFEVVSIRPAGPAPVGTRGGGPGAVGGTPPAGRGGPPAACPYRGTVLDPAQLTAPRITAFRLITWAYDPKACNLASVLVSGQPEWITTDLYDFMATIPVGTPAYGFEQLQNGTAPKLQEMLQTMLEDRFKLKIHREKKEVAAYDLVVAKPGKITPSKDQTPPPDPFLAGGGTRGALVGVLIGPDGAPRPGQTLLGSGFWQGTSIAVSALAGGFGARAGRPVVDKTGLTGFIDFKVPIAPDPNPNRGGLPTSLVGAGLSTNDFQLLDGLVLKM